MLSPKPGKGFPINQFLFRSQGMQNLLYTGRDKHKEQNKCTFKILLCSFPFPFISLILLYYPLSLSSPSPSFPTPFTFLFFPSPSSFPPLPLSSPLHSVSSFPCLPTLPLPFLSFFFSISPHHVSSLFSFTLFHFSPFLSSPSPSLL